MASFLYNAGVEKLLDGTIDWVADTIVAIPVTSGYTANRDHEFVEEAANDVNEEELGQTPAVTNYTPGHGNDRPALAGKAINKDNANDRVELDCNDWSLTNVGGASNDTIQAWVIAKQGTTDDTDARLIAYIDSAGGAAPLPYTTNGSTLNVTVNAEGLLQFPTA